MERTSSQNWFWPEWPCSWIRAVQFSRSSQPKRGKKGDPQLRGPIKSNCVQTDLRLNIFFSEYLQNCCRKGDRHPFGPPLHPPCFSNPVVSGNVIDNFSHCRHGTRSETCQNNGRMFLRSKLFWLARSHYQL